MHTGSSFKLPLSEGTTAPERQIQRQTGIFGFYVFTFILVLIYFSSLSLSSTIFPDFVIFSCE